MPDRRQTQQTFSNFFTGLGGSLANAGINRMANPPVAQNQQLVAAQTQEAQNAAMAYEAKTELYRERLKAAQKYATEMTTFMREAMGFQGPPPTPRAAPVAPTTPTPAVQPPTPEQPTRPGPRGLETQGTPTRPGPRGLETQGTPNKPMPFPAPLGDPNNPGSPRGPVSQGSPTQNRATQYLNAFSMANLRQRMQQRGLV